MQTVQDTWSDPQPLKQLPGISAPFCNGSPNAQGYIAERDSGSWQPLRGHSLGKLSGLSVSTSKGVLGDCV